MDRVESERGAVFVEWAIVSFGVIFGLILFLDVMQALNNYVLLSHVSNEVARNASRVPALEAGQFVNVQTCAAQEQACLLPGSATPSCGAPLPFPCGHNILQQRVRYMIQQMNLNIQPDSIQVTSEYIRQNDTSAAAINRDTVSVQVRVNYLGILLRMFPIHTTNQAPYLFGDS